MPKTPRSPDSRGAVPQKGLPLEIPPGRIEAQPFLKWAGGKSQLLKQFDEFFPKSIQRYRDPFVGGGAVFFHLKARFPALQAVLCDNNAELINCYEMVRDRAAALMAELDKHLQEFRLRGEDYYYQIRDRHRLSERLERASRMIFLNKACYNGLWRVNGRGEFNVPIGSYRPERLSLYDANNINAASRALKGAVLKVQDFRKSMLDASSDEFVYVDPPYHPVSATANFTAYTKEDFGTAEQKKLASLTTEAAQRGARLMLSNSDTPLVRQLYSGFTIKTVKARRAVNSDGAKRGLVTEVVVLSYE